MTIDKLRERQTRQPGRIVSARFQDEDSARVALS